MSARLGSEPSDGQLLAAAAELWTPANATKPNGEWTKARLLYAWSRKLVSQGLSTAEGVRSWARKFDFDVAKRTLRVKGIGPTSLFYLRMLALGEGIKPDTHVLDIVQQLLDEPRRRTPSREFVEDLEIVARELGTTPVLLDNSFWSARSGEHPPGSRAD